MIEAGQTRHLQQKAKGRKGTFERWLKALQLHRTIEGMRGGVFSTTTWQINLQNVMLRYVLLWHTCHPPGSYKGRYSGPYEPEPEQARELSRLMARCDLLVPLTHIGFLVRYREPGYRHGRLHAEWRDAALLDVMRVTKQEMERMQTRNLKSEPKGKPRSKRKTSLRRLAIRELIAEQKTGLVAIDDGSATRTENVKLRQAV